MAEVIRLHQSEGLGASAISERTGLPRRTVKDWIDGKVPAHSLHVLAGGEPEPECAVCGHEAHDFPTLPASYLYLLGLYLGDGCISEHRRQVYRLRLFLDTRYPAIVDEAESAMHSVSPRNRVNRLERGGSYSGSGEKSNVEVSAFSKSWPCLFPQHGPGKKHERRIWLSEWQQELAERWPGALLRGMVHSDGCRAINTGRGGWRHPRYSFGNLSTDITSIFCTACDKLELHWTAAFPEDERRAVTIYVSRKDDVARMDEFIGPKR